MAMSTKESGLTGRLTGEGNRPYEAFLAYRDMGPSRSIDKVARELKKSHTLIGRWSGEYCWVERARAHDDHCERVRQAAIERAIRLRATLWEKRAVVAIESAYEDAQIL